MTTYEVTVFGTDTFGNSWAQTHNLITEHIVGADVLLLRTAMEGVPYFEKGYSLHAIDGWEAKEEVRAS